MPWEEEYDKGWLQVRQCMSKLPLTIDASLLKEEGQVIRKKNNGCKPKPKTGAFEHTEECRCRCWHGDHGMGQIASSYLSPRPSLGATCMAFERPTNLCLVTNWMGQIYFKLPVFRDHVLGASCMAFERPTNLCLVTMEMGKIYLKLPVSVSRDHVLGASCMAFERPTNLCLVTMEMGKITSSYLCLCPETTSWCIMHGIRRDQQRPKSGDHGDRANYRSLPCGCASSDSVSIMGRAARGILRNNEKLFGGSFLDEQIISYFLLA